MPTPDALRHACTGCGGSCRGVRVRVLPSEEPALRDHAAALGVADPIEDGRLRFVDGACVFLAEDRCALHARYGVQAKPAVCRQYPLVVVDTESGRRAGIDPGCYSAWATRDAEPLAVEDAHAHPALLDPAAARQEAAILALLDRPGVTIDGVLAAIGVAPGFPDRWLGAVRAARLDALLARPDTGSAVRSALAGPVAALARLQAAPALVLGPEEEAWALEVTRRILALRLCASFPFVPGVALLALGGAYVCGWADARTTAFGPALAAWARAMRAPIWWSALVPGPNEMRALFQVPPAQGDGR